MPDCLYARHYLHYDLQYTIIRFVVITLFGSEFGQTDIFAQGLRKVRASRKCPSPPTPHKERQRTGLEETYLNDCQSSVVFVPRSSTSPPSTSFAKWFCSERPNRTVAFTCSLRGTSMFQLARAYTAQAKTHEKLQNLFQHKLAQANVGLCASSHCGRVSIVQGFCAIIYNFLVIYKL